MGPIEEPDDEDGTEEDDEDDIPANQPQNGNGGVDFDPDFW